jgi:hypothetical protein
MDKQLTRKEFLALAGSAIALLVISRIPSGKKVASALSSKKKSAGSYGSGAYGGAA